MAAFALVLCAATEDEVVWLDEVEVVRAIVLEAEVEVDREGEAMAVAFLVAH